MTRMNPATAKSKGRETENIFVEYLNDVHGLKTERRRLAGVLDKGDIAGWDGVCVEVKSGAKIAISTWLAELEAEITNSKAETGFVAVRPKGKPRVEDWYAVLPISVLLDLMKRAGYLGLRRGASLTPLLEASREVSEMQDERSV